jgi:hypothetical protein
VSDRLRGRGATRAASPRRPRGRGALLPPPRLGATLAGRGGLGGAAPPGPSLRTDSAPGTYRGCTLTTDPAVCVGSGPSWRCPPQVDGNGSGFATWSHAQAEQVHSDSDARPGEGAARRRGAVGATCGRQGRVTPPRQTRHLAQRHSRMRAPSRYEYEGQGKGQVVRGPARRQGAKGRGPPRPGEGSIRKRAKTEEEALLRGPQLGRESHALNFLQPPPESLPALAESDSPWCTSQFGPSVPPLVIPHSE